MVKKIIFFLDLTMSEIFIIYHESFRSHFDIR